jgi:predicted O-methyltransferase YrrM
MSRIFFIIKFLNYIVFAKHKFGYGIHSPFLYNFIVNVLNKNINHLTTFKIEALRHELLKVNKTISVSDLGAGSKVMISEIRKIKDIVKYSAVKKKYGELLFRMVDFYQFKSILELGTSLGIGTLYLATAGDDVEVYTIEACKETAKAAQKNFEKTGIKNIFQIVGDIDEELSNVLDTMNGLDLVYFDGNHQKEATLKYFYMCMTKIKNNTIFYFDDIHWSEGMEEAWNVIKSNKKVILSIDLFFSGIVFFNKDLSKQDVVVKY